MSSRQEKFSFVALQRRKLIAQNFEAFFCFGLVAECVDWLATLDDGFGGAKALLQDPAEATRAAIRDALEGIFLPLGFVLSV